MNPDAAESSLGRDPLPGAAPPAGLLDAMGAGAYAVDEQGLVFAVNAEAERLLRRPAADLVGQDAHDLLHRNRHGESIPRTQCAMRRAFLAGHTGQAELDWFECGDGTLLPISWFLTPWRPADGTVLTLVIFHAADEEERHVLPPGRLTELERLGLLAETTTRLTTTLDVGEALRRLVALVVPRLGDWAVVDLITERKDVRRAVVVHAEDGVLVDREDLQGPMPSVPEESPMPLSRALRGVASTLAGPQTYDITPDSGIAVEQRRLFDATGMHSVAIAPIRGVHDVLGALTLGRSRQPEPFTAADLPLLEDMARRAGLALENARLYQRQRKVAETMQRHLLPQLPRVPGLEMTARYLPAPDASQVGGDWYDAFVLKDGATALAIGDVVGHDLDAAAGMAQIRNMLRAYAWYQQEPPSRTVERIDQAVTHITDVPMATLVLGRITAGPDGRWELSWTNAGHPPPLLVTSDGGTRYLEGGGGILLGTGTGRPRDDATAPLPPGSTLVLYTDGLVEEPGRSLDEGLDRLSRHAASLVGLRLETFADHLLERVRRDDNDDDVALFVIRVPRLG